MTTDSSLSLAGKVAIVTGSGKENGIGAAIAFTLATHGARVVINYVSEATAVRAATVANKIEEVAGKGSVLTIRADISKDVDVKSLIEGTLKGFGVEQIDILVNNAAWASHKPVLSMLTKNIAKTFDICVFGPLALIQAVVPHMRNGGRIINTGSIASKLGIEPISGAAKAAMDALTFSLATSLGRDGKNITINTIMPGPVLTDSLPPSVPEVEALKASLLAQTRVEGRFGTPEDIADAALLLASEKSRWITGQVISVSGGITGG
ncbi:hypothetical protein NXS19_011261 [Fusarium pseudograminearum]|nr:hypothetical protein NXS19_011261 [Fusarium pseudograminearum]